MMPVWAGLSIYLLIMCVINHSSSLTVNHYNSSMIEVNRQLGTEEPVQS